MNKLLKTILIISIALFGTIFLFADSVQAVDGSLIIQFQNGNGQPLFNEANFLPGESVTRWVRVTNETGQTQPIATEAINYPNPIPADDLSRALTITISKGGTDLYGGSSLTGAKSLYGFYQDSEAYSEIYLSDIGNGETIQYDFTISFPSEAGDEWQGKTTNFDILVGSQGATVPPPSSPPSPPPAGGGGPPGLTILDESVTSTVAETSVTIIWTTTYFSTSQVIYDTLPGQFDFNAGPPYYGYTYSKEGDDTGHEKVTGHRVTITGLTPNTIYYFRCVSHGSLAIGTEHSFTTLIGTGGEGIEEKGEGEEEGEETPGPVILSEEEGEEGKKPEEIVEGPTEEGGIAEIIPEGEEEAPTEEEKEKGLVGSVSGGLASMIDALKGFGEQSFLYLIIILILIFIILILLYLLLRKKKKKEEEDENKRGTINLYKT